MEDRALTGRVPMPASLDSETIHKARVRCAQNVTREELPEILLMLGLHPASNPQEQVFVEARR
jgi:hypothetical protein